MREGAAVSPDRERSDESNGDDDHLNRCIASHNSHQLIYAPLEGGLRPSRN